LVLGATQSNKTLYLKQVIVFYFESLIQSVSQTIGKDFKDINYNFASIAHFLCATFLYKFPHPHTCIHTYTQIYACTCLHTQTYTKTYILTHMHTGIHTNIHINTHTSTHMHKHTYTQTTSLNLNLLMMRVLPNLKQLFLYLAHTFREKNYTEP
jgi:hypothetical protein